MLSRLLHELFIVDGIYLLHFDDRVSSSWKASKKHPFSDELKRSGKNIVGDSYHYPIYEIGHATLYENGTTGGASYIKKWKDMPVRKLEIFGGLIVKYIKKYI